MACTNCSTKTSDSGIPKGCGNKGSCGTDSCNKLSVFDWLSNMHYPSGFEPFDVVEVRFKNGRKDFYKNIDKLPLQIGDVVATEASPGHDVGVVTLTGELVKVQMKKKNVNPNGATLKIYRKASQRDIDVWTEVRKREEPMKVRAREIAIYLRLEMKISDIEFQGDGSKSTFYYTANDRVDFRQLIKEFAREFNVRIEMKQVGFRQEAARLGGIGSCGRELCCSTWLTDFRSVNTAAARYQQLSLNPQKLAGQCGKLKCCLNYELDTYLDALKNLPATDTRILTKKGEVHCQKLDIFKEIMWFAYADNMANWYKLEVGQVKELLEMNKQGKTVDSIEDYVFEEEDTEVKSNVVAEDSLSRFDQPKRKKRPQRNKKKTPETTTAGTEKKAITENRARRPQRHNRNTSASDNTKTTGTNQGRNTPRTNSGENSRETNQNTNNQGRNKKYQSNKNTGSKPKRDTNNDNKQ
ncbi:MAG TPA: regulatory iron-sulfur-containing complex subunit RicT [Flavobacterium sp.]|nr:regulatory iron-sulfur-containing complex subunit RicT [Flavobacterium sp.]